MTAGCVNGRVRVSELTVRQLFAESGGYCMWRGEPLLQDLSTKTVSIAEIAHIVAATKDGPRGTSGLDADERAKAANLILLCPTCHVVIDKAPHEFSVEIVAAWKAERIHLIARTVGAPKLSDRKDARRYLQGVLEANRVVFDKYGPEQGEVDYIGEKAGSWRRKAIETIIPNSYRALAMLDLNRSLLRAEETSLVEEWRQHVDDLAARHVLNIPEVGGLRFPVGILTILEEE
jgi:hypothetical protein